MFYPKTPTCKRPNSQSANMAHFEAFDVLSEKYILSSKLLKQGYLVERLKSSFRKFYGRYGDLVEQYGVTHSRMLNDILTLDQQ